jgi:hypothetical protein
VLAISAMRLEFGAALQKTLAEQKKNFVSQILQQQKQVGTLVAGLQKVSAQLEVKKAAPQTVLNDN